jgi:biopolymer transport protein ExbB|tara:strand:- start:7775 stop:8578 length:804 start_codon:yes stop_codon:yes gene_type:complete
LFGSSAIGLFGGVIPVADEESVVSEEAAANVDAAADATVEAATEGAETLTGLDAAAAAAGTDGGIWELIPLVDKGGPIVVILLALSVLSLAIILLKVFQFWRAGLTRRAFIDVAIDKVKSGDTDGAAAVLRKTRSPVARTLLAGVEGAQNGGSAEEEIARVGGNELGGLQSYFRWLEVIGNISPLLGLLGTVIGMINAFQQLQLAGNKVDPAILSGGIWVALLTTAVGLAVAIPAIASLNLLESRVDMARLTLRDASSRLLAALKSA